MPVSLKAQIMENLNPKKGKKNVAPKTVMKNKSSQRSKKSLSEAKGTGTPAAFKQDITRIYQGKSVIVESYNPNSGMAVIRLGRGRNGSVIVRAVDLQKPAQLNEAVLGMATIGTTWKERPTITDSLEALTAADIGLFFEDDEKGEKDDNEEDHDNGSNVRHDGHTGKKEVDELPTPSDTIAPAYDDEKAPKQLSSPLSTEPGHTVAKDPDMDGYDYPADAPDIPDADYPGSDMGNSRAPTMGGGHDAGDNLDKRGDSDDDELEENFMGFEKLEKKMSKGRDPSKLAMDFGKKKYGKKKACPMGEGFAFVSEDGGMADRYVDFKDKGGTDQDFMAGEQHGAVTPGQIPQPRGMGGDMAHQQQYGNMNSVRTGTGPTEIPSGRPKIGTANSDRSVARMPDGKPTFDMDDAGHFRNDPAFGTNFNFGGAVPNAVAGMSKQEAPAPIPQVPQHGPNLESAIRTYRNILAEFDESDSGDSEPQSGDTITVTLPAMASILVTIAHKMGADIQPGGQDEVLLKSVVEALAEFGSSIDVSDLPSIAAHINGEETQEVENREAGRPDHAGMGGEPEERPEPADTWPGDGQKSRTGKTQMMDARFQEGQDFYGIEDLLAETRLTEEEELRLIKRRSGMKYW